MELDFLKEILPSILSTHFDLVSYRKLGNTMTKSMELEIFLDEKNVVPSGFEKTDYESKGFTPSSRIQDFPIRGQAVYLVIRRRKWRHKITNKEIRSNYSIVSQGAKLTQELSAFLKATGRDPSRYDK